MTTGMVREQNLEKQIDKQMGCMAGFLQLFDRHQLLAGKKIHTAKRLTSTAAAGEDNSPERDKSAAGSPSVSKPAATPSPERRKQSPVAELKSGAPPETQPPKSPSPLPVFELKEGAKSSWKLKETGRLSLDSRASYDAAEGSLHRKEIRKDRVILSESTGNDGDGDDDKQRPRSSTSVIAKLMGLEPLWQPDSEPVKQAELRRSASESRVSRDLFHCRFIDSNNIHLKLTNQSHSSVSNNQMEKAFVNEKTNVRQQSKASPKSTWRSVFEAAEVFPEPPKKAVVEETVLIERRLKMRGIDEASRDLETLKQILEAWQLKGLLHSSRTSELISHRNVIYDRSFTADESPATVTRRSRSPIHRRIDNDSSPSRRRNLNLAGENLPSASPRPDRNVRIPTRARSPSDGNARPPNSMVKPKPLTVETQRRVNESTERRRAISPNRSPKVSPRRTAPDRTVPNRSPINGRRSTAETYQKQKITTVITEDESSSSISESTVSASSQTDTERLKMEEYKDGRSLLERCDKLLHSIAEMNATDQQQSSPVSVLDASFYESSASPSPIMKRTIDFKDHLGEVDEQTWSQVILQTKSDDISDDGDLVYISEILRASDYLPKDSDIFSLLEKQQYIRGKDTSKVSRLQRKLIFDTIIEILERNRELLPWKAALSWKECSLKPTLQKIWSEFQKIREHSTCADDLVEIIYGVVKKDLTGDNVRDWGECAMERSEVVLEIERMIYRDLVGEAIRDLAAVACQSAVLVAPCRKLVF